MLDSLVQWLVVSNEPDTNQVAVESNPANAGVLFREHFFPKPSHFNVDYRDVSEIVLARKQWKQGKTHTSSTAEAAILSFSHERLKIGEIG